MARCKEFITIGKENQHLKTKRRQMDKLNRLIQKKKQKENKEECGKVGSHNENHSNDANTNNYTNNNTMSFSMPWVKNLSSIPLTQAQTEALSHGPNFAMVPKEPPLGEYISAIEHACSKLPQGKAEELRAEVKSILKKTKKTRYSNTTIEERKAMQELRRDTTRIILTADKGVSLVVMDRAAYDQKAKELLHQPTYKPIPKDPTSKYKTKLINLLKSIKAEGGMDEKIYKRLYPTGAGSPKFYGLPKVHKAGTPLRPIVSSIGAVAYNTSKEIARILKPLVGKSPHHIHNNLDLMKQLKDIKLGPDDTMVSYDVKALFTSVPINTCT